MTAKESEKRMIDICHSGFGYADEKDIKYMAGKDLVRG